MSTNEPSASKSRARIIKEATYAAAVRGCYDTSAAAQKAGFLIISIVDLTDVPGEPLPPDATHHWYVMVDGTGWMVTQYTDGYKVDPRDQLPKQREERELRDAVLEAALWHLTSKPERGLEGEEREAAIKELLEDGNDERDPADPIAHPVIRDERPLLTLGDGDDAVPAQRQWAVEVGPRHRCRVAFFGYDADDGMSLLTQDVEGA